MQKQIRKSLSELKCIRIHFQAEAIEEIYFPSYMGSTIRGAFGVILKQSVCVTKQKKCSECMLQYNCVYSYIFETPIPANSKVMRKQTNIPHPFTLSDMSDLKKYLYKPGEVFSFTLTLVGKSIDSLPYCVYSMIRLGEAGIGKTRGKFKLIAVKEIDAQNNICQPIYEHDTLNMPRKRLSFDIAEKLTSQYFKETNKISLKFISPLRIKYRNKICDHADFHIIIRSLIRRLSNLAYFHCNSQSDLQFKEIIEKAHSIEIANNNMAWYDWERYSTRQKDWMNLGGIIGDITYEGNIKDFIPILIMGSWVNIGKGTAFGLGNYTLLDT